MKQQLFAFLLVLFTLISCGDKPLDPSKPRLCDSENDYGRCYCPVV